MYLCGCEDEQMKYERIDFWENVYGFNMSALKEVALKEPVVDIVDPKVRNYMRLSYHVIMRRISNIHKHSLLTQSSWLLPTPCLFLILIYKHALKKICHLYHPFVYKLNETIICIVW